MDSIFGPPLPELTLEHLERFFSAADREPLLWEAKGKVEPHPGTIRKHVCGFGNRLGGWLIIGAQWGENKWVVDGVDFNDAEPERWIGDAIQSLRSAPLYDVNVIDAAGKKKVAVVEVEPVAVPPCMTPTGTVYQRVSGKTVAVTEPLVLLELTQRGEELRQRALQRAKAHAAALVNDRPTWPRGPSVPPIANHPAVFGLALAAVGPPADIALRPFRNSFRGPFEAAFDERMRPASVLTTPSFAHHSQGAAWIHNDIDDGYSIAFAHRDGTIAVSIGADAEEIDTVDTFCSGTLPKAWRFAGDMLQAMGCTGEAICALYCNGRLPVFQEHSRRKKGVDVDLPVLVELPTAVRPPTDEELANVDREVHRGAGGFTIEPEPPVANPPDEPDA
jgi:hypothetical protein